MVRAAWAIGLLALSGSAAALDVQGWVTSGDQSRLMAAMPVTVFGAQGQPLPLLIEVDALRRYQAIVGFGAAITDASAWLIRERLDQEQGGALMQELFGRDEGGVGFSLARLSIGASDFSLKHYSLDERKPGAGEQFSIDENRAYLLPVVKQALAINPALQIIASPWSAPSWMKTSGQLIKGSLRPDRYEDFAGYLLRYVDAYAAEGVPVFALTLQNEPHFEPEDYPGMRLDPPARATLIGQHLGPMIAKRTVNKPQLIEWDHNWDVPESPLAVLADPAARRYVDGVGWHCYGGDVRAQSVVHEAHPDKDTWFTECSGGEWAPSWSANLLWMSRHLVIGATRHWARGVLLWNLALDEQHGPHRGGCKDCRGVVTIDSKTGAITRNPEFYALAHASRFVRPGARRIASTAAAGALESVAFQHEDDGRTVLIVSNVAAEPLSFSVRQSGQFFNWTMPAESIATLVWTPP